MCTGVVSVFSILIVTVPILGYLEVIYLVELGFMVLKDLEFPEPIDFKAIKLESYSCRSQCRRSHWRWRFWS